MLDRVLSAVMPRDPSRHKALPIDASQYQSLGELLTDALIQFKSEVALIEQRRKNDPAHFSYREFQRLGEQLAAALEASGIGPGDRVAVLMSNQPRWLLAAYATFFRGAILVPLDYKLAAEEQAALLAHAQPKLLFIDRPLLERFNSAPPVSQVVVSDDLSGEDLPEDCNRFMAAGGNGKGSVLGARTTLSGWSQWLETGMGRGSRLAPRSREDVACIVYSSGTGGTPKGCLLTHGNYLAQYQALRALFPMKAGDRFFSILPTNHAIDFMSGFIGPFGSGATVVHQRTLRPDLVRHTMKTQRITHIAVVPLILEGLGRALEERVDELDQTRRSALELLTEINGRLTARAPWMAASRTLLSAVHKEFGGHLEVMFCGGAFVEPHYPELFHRYGIPVVIGYGLTEACTVATLNELSPFRSDSVGRPVPGVEVKIHDPSADGIGEVLLKGDTVMKGYLNEPELTAQTIDQNGFLHTGDVGYLDASGHLHLVGRSKNLIVTPGGKNVYPEDVEGAFQKLPAPELAVVSSGAVWKSELGREALVLVVRLSSEESSADFVQLVHAANQQLPEHKRVASVLFFDEEFPRTASMKLKRGALNQRLQAISLERATPLS